MLATLVNDSGQKGWQVMALDRVALFWIADSARPTYEYRDVHVDGSSESSRVVFSWRGMFASPSCSRQHPIITLSFFSRDITKTTRLNWRHCVAGGALALLYRSSSRLVQSVAADCPAVQQVGSLSSERRCLAACTGTGTRTRARETRDYEPQQRAEANIESEREQEMIPTTCLFASLFLPSLFSSSLQRVASGILAIELCRRRRFSFSNRLARH